MKALWLILPLALPGELLAQAACPANDPVSVVDVPGFTCTLGDKTFSAFTLTNVPGSAQIQFGQLGPLFAVTLSRDGVFFPTGTLTFDYTITAAATHTILIGTVGVDVSFPPEVTVTTMNGQTVSIANGGTGQINFSPGAQSVAVTNTSHILTSTTELNSITNDFSQVPISIPEPGPLPLIALGLGLVILSRWPQRE